MSNTSKLHNLIMLAAKSKNKTLGSLDFEAVTLTDILGDFIRKTRFKTASFERFSDRNHLQGKDGKTIRLKWLSAKGTSIDTVASDFVNEYPHLNLDEQVVTEMIVNFIISNPSGYGSYASMRMNELRKEIEAMDEMAAQRGIEINNESEDSWKAFEITKLKPTIEKNKTMPKAKTHKKITTGKKSITAGKNQPSRKVKKVKQSLTAEFAAIKRFFNLNGKRVKTTQLTSLLAVSESAIKQAKAHKFLLKTIIAKLSVAIDKLTAANVGTIAKFQISKDLLQSVENIINSPKVTSVTLGGTQKLSRAQKQYIKEVDLYKWFVVDMNAKKAISGWENRTGAFDSLSDFNQGVDKLKILAKTSLKKFGIADPTEKWKGLSYEPSKKKAQEVNTPNDIALHGIEQYTDDEMKTLGISYEIPSLGKLKKSPYDIINEKLIAILKSGDIPWIDQRTNAPYKGQDGTLRNYFTKRPYSGVNVIMLASNTAPHHNSFFATKKQIEEKGGTIKKGAASFQVVFTKKLKIDVDVPATEAKPASTEQKSIWYLNTYTVYNLADTDVKLKDTDLPKAKTEQQVIESCETIYPNMPKKPELRFGGTRAFYQPATDKVQMPKQDNFTSLQGYYRTLFHELAHSTGHKSRINRNFSLWGESKREYSIEELIAEIASSYICGFTGIYFANEKKHASYLNHYLKELHGNKLEQYKADLVLKAQTDKTFLLHAIGAAQKAANFILSKQLAKIKNEKKVKSKKSLSGLESDSNAIDSVTNNIVKTIKVVNDNEYNFKPATEKPDKPIKTFRIGGQIGELLGDLQRYKLQIIISGETHSSKSEIAKQIADGFAEIGDDVAWIDWEQGGLESRDTQASIDRNVSPKNKAKFHVSSDVPRNLEAVKKLALTYPVIALDSGTKLNIGNNAWIDQLREEHPETVWINIMQQNGEGGTRGGSAAEFDAPVVLKTYRADEKDFKKNYAYVYKNRGNKTGLKYNIAGKKIVKDTALSGVDKKKGAKK